MLPRSCSVPFVAPDFGHRAEAVPGPVVFDDQKFYPGVSDAQSLHRLYDPLRHVRVFIVF